MLGAPIRKPMETYGRIAAISVKPSRYTVLIPLKGDRVLAFNTASRAFAVWTKDEQDMWTALLERGTQPFEAKLRPFVQGGFVVNAVIDEVAAQRENYDKTRNDDGHIMFTIAPTLSCNFACHYCFQGLDKPLTKMTKSVRAETKEYLLAQIEGRRSVHMTWYGGEPLMDQETIFELSDALIEKCDLLGIRYSAMMISNGYRMTEAVSEKLQKARVI